MFALCYNLLIHNFFTLYGHIPEIKKTMLNKKIMFFSIIYLAVEKFNITGKKVIMLSSY